jgi:hypothetical protein
MMLVVGCGPAVPVDGDDSATGDTSTATTEAPTTSGLPTTTGVTTTSTSTGTTGVTTVGETTTGIDDESSSGSPFIVFPDGGVCLTHCTECDAWSQDCPEGEKCAPWANDGGDQWNALTCRELDPSPAQPGDPCTIEGEPTSGDDDCDISSMCWDVDPNTGVGTCVPFCGGNQANPVCEGDTSCWIANDGALILCLPMCNPLASTCGDGVSCVASGDEFFCVPDEVVPQSYNDPCAPATGCGDGLVCVGAGATPKCDGNCCTALCDLTAPACPDEAAGQVCVAYYERGMAPEGFENLGACVIE